MHPEYLDTKGLVALWREALLAQKVLRGETKGYRRHPQLQPFKETAAPVAAIATYLSDVHAEASRRDFKFDASKIARGRFSNVIDVTDGQISYEMVHLMRKLWKRDRKRYLRIRNEAEVEQHPMFRIVAGPVAEWEVVS